MACQLHSLCGGAGHIASSLLLQLPHLSCIRYIEWPAHTLAGRGAVPDGGGGVGAGAASDARLMAALQRSTTAAREAKELDSNGPAQHLRLFAERR